MSFNVIPFTADGETHLDTQLGNLSVSLVSRYNYRTECWAIDIFDASGNPMLVGLVLVPGVDILAPHTDIKRSVGSIVPVEKTVGAYKDPDALGNTLQVLWYPVGAPVVLP